MFVVPTTTSFEHHAAMVTDVQKPTGTGGSDWLDFVATAAQLQFPHVVVIVPTLDAAGERTSRALSEKWQEIDIVTGSKVLVLLPAVPPQGAQFSALDWGQALVKRGGTGAAARHMSAARRTDPLEIIARLRQNLADLEQPVKPNSYLLYLDFAAANLTDAAAGDITVLGQAVNIGLELDEKLLSELCVEWRAAADRIDARIPQGSIPEPGTFVKEVHGGIVPTRLSWKILGREFEPTVELLKKWMGLLKG